MFLFFASSFLHLYKSAENTNTPYISIKGGAVVYQPSEKGSTDDSASSSGKIFLKGNVVVIGNFNEDEKTAIEKSPSENTDPKVQEKRRIVHNKKEKKYSDKKYNKHFYLNRDSNETYNSLKENKLITSLPKNNYKFQLIEESLYLTKTQISHIKICNEFETQFILNDFYSSFYCRPPPIVLS